MVIWYTLLNNVNRVSKELQVEDMHIDVAMDHLNGLICFFKQFRENGFESSLVEAKKIANEMEIEPLFDEKRIIRRKRQFDENNSEETMQSSKESFKVNYFLYIVDQGLSSLESRFEQIKKYDEIFGFLYDLERLKHASYDSLKSSCSNLENYLKHGMISDIDGA